MTSSDKKKKSLIDLNELRQSKANYIDFVLCGQEDPYKTLFAERLKSVVGPRGSNLLAMVRITTAGRKAKQYRVHANREIFENTELQQQIRERFLASNDEFRVHRVNNPVILKDDGAIIRLCWHHSPNHIGSVSLIPLTIHGRNLHVNGMGGRRFEVPGLEGQKNAISPLGA